MSENELLKKINREIKITSLENSEKQKNEKEELIIKEEDEENKDDNKNNNNTDENELENNNKNNTEDAVEKIAKENIDDFKDEVSTDILSSDPKLLAPEELPLERNEIDDVDSVDGILNDVKQDKTSDFIDPDSKAENNLNLKVVDTSLGVFTVLNYDENSVLLMDCNKQKIQISIDDFNNLHPFEIKDDQLSTINDFTDAYNKDLKAEKEEDSDNKKDSDNNSESEEDNQTNNQEEEEFENSENEENIDLSDINFGESLNRNNLKKDSNLLSEIQKRLSKKQGVSETIRSDVRSKNRCVLVAKKSKLSKDKELSFNETKPRTKGSKSKTFESKKIIKKETTQPSAIITPPKPLSDKKDDFNIKKVLTIKDGKFIYVKLEGKTQIAYLKLKIKNNLLSINKLNESLKQVDSFFESLNCICNNFYILEKEIVMKKFRKYEAEDVEDIDNELEFDDVDVNDEDDDVEIEEDEVVDDEDVEEDNDDENKEESEDEKEKDSIHFSTEINGVRYSGTLYRDDHDEVDSEDEDEDVEEDNDEVEEDEEDDVDESDDDLILTSEEELDSLDFPEGMDESVIKARARIYGKRYNVSFCNVKQESVKRAKLEMRRHNIVEAWNALVKGAKSIKC